MKKIYRFLSLIMCCALLAGCCEQGDTQEKDIQQDTKQNTQQVWQQDTQQAEPQQQTGELSEYTDILFESTILFPAEDVKGKFIGMQFYQGEPVLLQLCRDEVTSDTRNIYLCKKGGDKELLLKGVSEKYFSASWFLDVDRYLYCWTWDDKDFVKMDSSGKELFHVSFEDMGVSGISKMCQFADGRLFLAYREGAMTARDTVAEVAPDTGEISKVNAVVLDGWGSVAAGEEGLVYMDETGVYEINMTNGSKTSVLSFLGTFYMLPDSSSIMDFRVLPEGKVELLQRNSDFDGISKVLRLGTKTTQKAVLSLRGYDFSRNASSSGIAEGWLKTQIQLFNQQNDNYMIVLDESLDGQEREDFARQTSIELATGKGPDIMFGDVLGEYLYGAIQKGALADMSPLMESSGIKEEDYLPAAFSCWKENGRIYGACVEVSLIGYRIDQEILGGNNEPDIESLVDALLAWPEDAVLLQGQDYDSQWVLEYLLRGSEDLWGMVNWETGICDFSGELFAKILETAKRYGYDERENYPELLEPRFATLLGFDSAAIREAEGKVAAGALFDDGCQALIENSLSGSGNEMLAINANSAHVEGAWEFISYLLGEELQSTFDDDFKVGYSSRIPVNRKACNLCLEKRIAKIIDMKEEAYAFLRFDESTGEVFGMYERSYKDLTEEKLSEYMEFLENARAYPLRTVPILDIISEEAEYYFNGTKNIEEVSAVVRNRVQLYMDENN